jgi:sulfotransferase family protein
MTRPAYPKVWGVGLARTGTTTLCQVLQKLGYQRVLHNPHFPQLETADAAADNECALFYRYLDYRFPGSKFILTTRPLENWLKSIKWVLDTYPVRSTDENVPIFRRMTLYGTVIFDERKMSLTYERHHREVRDYFADRPSDLLEIDFSRGDGWEKICPFLGFTIPDEMFPHLNARLMTRVPMPRTHDGKV